MGKVILHIDMNAFFATVEKILDPSLKDKPIVIGHDSSRSVVSTACYLARKYVLTNKLIAAQSNYSAFKRGQNNFVISVVPNENLDIEDMVEEALLSALNDFTEEKLEEEVPVEEIPLEEIPAEEATDVEVENEDDAVAESEEMDTTDNEEVVSEETIVEENKEPVFTIQKVVLYSSAEYEDLSVEQNLQDISIHQYTDIALYISNDKTQDGSMKAKNTEYVHNFCKTLEERGYYAGIYGSDISTFKDLLFKDNLKHWTWWVARYGNEPSYARDSMSMWQNTSTGQVPGVLGNVDMDICYKNFPDAILKHNLNIRR